MSISLPQYKLSASSGFTLIETIVAVMILSYAILGPFALTAHSLRVSREARQQLAATYLAQEAIEVAQSVRSNNSADDTTLTRDAWMDGIFSNCQSGCVVNAMAEPSVATDNIWLKSTPPDSAASSQLPLMACVGACDTEPIVYNTSPGLYFAQSSSAPPVGWTDSGYTRVLVVSAPFDPTPGTPVREVVLTATVTYRGYGNVLRTVMISETLYNWFPELL